MKKICIIASFRNEEECISKFIEKIDEAFRAFSNLSYRILFIDDFSTDNTKQIIIDKMKRNNQISLISF